MLDWELVTAAIFFFLKSLSGTRSRKQEMCTTSLADSTTKRTTPIPVPFTWPCLLLWVPVEKWQKVLVTYALPTLTQMCYWLLPIDSVSLPSGHDDYEDDDDECDAHKLNTLSPVVLYDMENKKKQKQ